MTNQQNALCGRCKVELEVVANDDGELGRCPQCGNSDTLDNIMRIVGDYALEHAAKGIDDIIGGMAKGNKAFKYTPNVRPKTPYRFIINMDGH